MDFQTIKQYVKGLSVGIAFLFGVSIVSNEGLPGQNSNGNYEPYKDPIGITTVCYGYVPRSQAEIQKEYTQKECDILLYKTIQEYSVVLNGLPPQPLSTTVGFLDFGYNAGIAAANNSNIKKCLMKQDTLCASKAVLEWRYVSKTKLTQKDKQLGQWTWNQSKGKYFYDCSQYVNGKPNKMCYGLYTRRLMESDLLKGTMTDPVQIENFIKQYYYKG